MMYDQISTVVGHVHGTQCNLAKRGEKGNYFSRSLPGSEEYGVHDRSSTADGHVHGTQCNL